MRIAFVFCTSYYLNYIVLEVPTDSDLTGIGMNHSGIDFRVRTYSSDTGTISNAMKAIQTEAAFVEKRPWSLHVESIGIGYGNEFVVKAWNLTLVVTSL